MAKWVETYKQKPGDAGKYILKLEITFAIGGMANLRDNGGVDSESSRCSSQEYTSFR